MSIIDLAESFGLNVESGMDGTTNAARRTLTPARAKALTEASQLWGKAWDGNRMAAVAVQEALTTSDLFKSATGDLLDRELLATYQDITPSWQEWASATRVRNFKPKKLVDIMGGKSALDLVPELTEFPYAKSSSHEYEIAAKKFGRRFGFSWEAGINDDLDELQQIPGRFGSAASLTEDVAALEQIATLSTGAPLSGFFKSYNAAAAGALGYSAFNNSGTAALSTDAVIAALNGIATRKDSQGNLVPHQGLVLMVGPGLQFDAERILNAAEVRVTNGDTTTVEPNPLRGKVRLVVNNMLAGTSWFLLPDPRRNQRPAVSVAKLVGFETPDLRVSSNTGSRVGGGSIAPTEGDFEIDGVWYRVRHVAGAAALDPIHTFASTGAA